MPDAPPPSNFADAVARLFPTCPRCKNDDLRLIERDHERGFVCTVCCCIWRPMPR